MKQKNLYGIWAGLYILCALLGFVTQPNSVVKAALFLISVIFFVPGLMLLLNAIAHNDKKTIGRIRWICIASLGLTMVALIANLLSVNTSVATGNTLYAFLVIVSSPMACSQYWIVSLFLWACMLMGTIFRFKK